MPRRVGCRGTVSCPPPTKGTVIDVGEILRPRTDAGAFGQLAVVVFVWLGVLWGVRRRPDARLVTFGAGLLLVGLMGLRAAH